MKRLQTLWNKIKEEKLIIISLCGLLLIGLFCWIGFDQTKEFGLNFFTEMLGVAVTVFIIDRLIHDREEKRNIPQKLAAYEDVRLYTSRYISFWTDAYRQSVPENAPESIEGFFSEQGMTRILYHLYMDAEPNVTPKRTWWDWIVYTAKEFKDNGDKILDRHSNNLDPKVFGYIHQLTESMFLNVLLLSPSIRQSDTSMNFPRIKTLGNYSMTPPIEDYQAILGLVKWCNETFSTLSKYSKSIKKVAEYDQIKNQGTTPKSMIPAEVLEKQIFDLQEFRKNN